MRHISRDRCGGREDKFDHLVVLFPLLPHAQVVAHAQCQPNKVKQNEEGTKGDKTKSDNQLANSNVVPRSLAAKGCTRHGQRSQDNET